MTSKEWDDLWAKHSMRQIESEKGSGSSSEDDECQADSIESVNPLAYKPDIVVSNIENEVSNHQSSLNHC